MIDFQFKRGILCKRILMAKTTTKNNWWQDFILVWKWIAFRSKWSSFIFLVGIVEFYMLKLPQYYSFLQGLFPSSSCAILFLNGQVNGRNPNTKGKNWSEYSGTQHRMLQEYTLLIIDHNDMQINSFVISVWNIYHMDKET